jgi:hypothetical protein
MRRFYDSDTSIVISSARALASIIQIDPRPRLNVSSLTDVDRLRTEIAFPPPQLDTSEWINVDTLINVYFFCVFKHVNRYPI